MWRIKVFSVLISLAAFGFFSGVVNADRMEDLEVTMEVLDDPAQLDDVISRQRRPDDNVVDDEDWEYEDGAYDERDDEDIAEAFDADEGDFEMEDEFEEDRKFEEDAIDDEDEFEDGEDVDLDF